MVGNLETKTGTAGETTFAYDENGRMLSQGDASARLDYVYGPGSYAVSRATGRTPMDGDRDASRTGNFRYDASGRMVFDSSRSLSVTYDMEGLPAVFLQDSGSGTWRELSVYDPAGWRVAAYSYENGALVSLRIDMMLDGRKELERRTAFSSGGNSVAEYAMLYGSGGALGRRHADGTYEWYVKDRQGSLVMSVVDGGVGSALVYEPFGFQRLLRVSGDVPAEQYTGKEYDGRLGLTYFGARYFDPSFALWLTPDPAGQYLNPYSYGGDPVNAVDFDGRWSWGTVVGLGIAELLTLGLVSEVAGAMVSNPISLLTLATNSGRELSNHGTNMSEWDWGRIGNNTATSAMMGLLGGPEGAASLITPVSIVTRCFYADDCGGVIGDAFTGGFAIDNLGHKLGLYNAVLLGGTADWYQGHVTYSGGACDYIFGDDGIFGGTGAEFFGHALFVQYRDRKSTIAHEIDHVQQMETRGARIMSILEYMADNSWDPSYNSPTYHRNPREMDAYYREFLYKQGCVDVYGERRACLGMGKDEWTHEQLSDMFYNGYGHKDETEKFVWDHVGYKYYDGVGAAYGEHWTWHEGWWLETGFGVFSRWGHGWSW